MEYKTYCIIKKCNQIDLSFFHFGLNDSGASCIIMQPQVKYAMKMFRSMPIFAQIFIGKHKSKHFIV